MPSYAPLDLARAVPGKFVMAEDNGLSYKVKSEDLRYEVYFMLRKDLSGSPDVMMKFGRDLLSNLPEALSNWRVAAGKFEHGGGWWKQTLMLREK